MLRGGPCRVTRAEARKVWEQEVSEFVASGMSLRQWCKHRGVGRSRLSYWVNKLSEVKQKSALEWLRVDEGEGMGSAQAPCPACMIGIRIGSALIETRPGFDPELLVEVVRALAKC